MSYTHFTVEERCCLREFYKAAVYLLFGIYGCMLFMVF